MVDASHGGKTGIDFNHTKNMIGTYHPAKSIYINTLFLQTLSERNLLSGTAEMIKHALLDSQKSLGTKYNSILSTIFHK